MSPALPEGDAAPDDGALPTSAFDRADERAFAVYLHVPFCTVRCGYCDFNTYTAGELGGGASQVAYADTWSTPVASAVSTLVRQSSSDSPGVP